LHTKARKYKYLDGLECFFCYCAAVPACSAEPFSPLLPVREPLFLRLVLGSVCAGERDREAEEERSEDLPAAEATDRLPGDRRRETAVRMREAGSAR
jgi:hypothetical protein